MAGRTFELRRPSGTVADGVEFPDDSVVIRWRGEHPSTVVWESIRHAVAINESDGVTQVVWDEDAPTG